jgi:hypothetical protein
MTHKMFRRTASWCAVIALSPVAAAHAQGGILGRMLDRAVTKVEQEIDRKASDTAAGRQPARPVAPSTSSSPASTPATAATPLAGRSIGPRATERQGEAPRNLWLDVRYGAKFIPPAGKPQIIATNPYLLPDRFLFTSLQGLACLPDGGLIVSGKGWENGDVSGIGWWRIAADGAVTPLAAWPEYPRTARPEPYKFSAASDGSLLTASEHAIYRVRGEAVERLAGRDGTSGYRDGPASDALFKAPGVPVEDGMGNIWVADQQGCVLRRIASDGMVSTVIGQALSGCGERSGGERIPLDTIAWDAVHGESVAGGSTMVAQPTHDMHVTVWRIRPDGQARRVYYTVKAGRSAIGQNMDTIWTLAVDPQGAIFVATRPIPGFARRQIMRLDEKTARLVPVTGAAFGDPDIRPGREEDPYDGPAAHASFRESKRMCFGPDRTLFVLDEHLLRRVNTDGTVRTWAY